MIYSDIIEYLARDLGVPCIKRVVAYNEAIKDLKNGKADILIMYPNEQVEEFGIRVAPIITLTNIVISRAGTKYMSKDFLSQILPLILKEDVFALKGGTAINFFLSMKMDKNGQLFRLIIGLGK